MTAQSFLTARADHSHGLHHAAMHVIHEMAVESPVARLIRRQVKLRACAWLNDDDVLARLLIGILAIDQEYICPSNDHI